MDIAELRKKHKSIKSWEKFKDEEEMKEFIKDFHPLVSEYDLKDYYYINQHGTIIKYRPDKNKMVAKYMRPFVNRDGYIEYVLTLKDGKKKHLQGHRLVALTFHGIPDEYMDANHKDGIRQNNHKDNIEWLTHSENVEHSYRVIRGR